MNQLTIDTSSGRSHKIVTTRKNEVAAAIAQAQSGWLRSQGRQGGDSDVAGAELDNSAGRLAKQERGFEREAFAERGAGDVQRMAAFAPDPPARRHAFPKFKVMGIAVSGIVVLGVIISPKQPAPGTDTQTSTVLFPSLPMTGNKAHDMLAALPEADQARHLGNMVEEGCDGRRAFYMGMDKELAANWSVGCLSGASYEVGIGNDDQGTSTALDCRTLKAMANIDCFATLDSQRGRPPQTQKQFMCAVAQLPPRVREQAMRRFIQNLYDYAREDGARVPDTKEKRLQEFLRQLDKEARRCPKQAR